MLLLFDIDGTLMQGATKAHAAALHEALHSVHGIDPRRTGLGLSPAGRTDGEIARAILLDAGVSAERIDDRAEEVRAECCRIYAETAGDDLSRFVIDGIPEVLQWLGAQDGVKLSLVTGNYEPVARLKLRHAGLLHWFPAGQGAFGSDDEDRASLPPIARRRAGQPGAPYPRAKTVVIGDTPRDIACAQADGLRCVAVATGPFAAEDLTAADQVVGCAAELRDALTDFVDV
jgi:phosphoglycolate phosphatase